MDKVSSDITVKIDDRVRLLSSLLAATRFPEDEWKRNPHGSHLHARATRKRLAQFTEHPSVAMLQAQLEQQISLESLFTAFLNLELADFSFHDASIFPADFDKQLQAFFTDAGLQAWWESEHDWRQGADDMNRLLNGMALKDFFRPFFGEIPETLVLMPNILYPSDQEITLRFEDQLIVIVPPRVAWGESPPWPYGEDPAHVYRAAIQNFGIVLMHEYLGKHAEALAQAAQTPLPLNDAIKALYPTWEAQFTVLFCAAAVALYLEDHVNVREANAFALMERKTRGIDILPAAISVLRRYRGDLATGKYRELADFLPMFPKQLKLATRIKAL